jgi:hypothetical protein
MTKILLTAYPSLDAEKIELAVPGRGRRQRGEHRTTRQTILYRVTRADWTPGSALAYHAPSDDTGGEGDNGEQDGRLA